MRHLDCRWAQGQVGEATARVEGLAEQQRQKQAEVEARRADVLRVALKDAGLTQ
jgi:hypothetical protein